LGPDGIRGEYFLAILQVAGNTGLRYLSRQRAVAVQISVSIIATRKVEVPADIPRPLTGQVRRQRDVFEHDKGNVILTNDSWRARITNVTTIIV
jgi:hypothetical protein